MTALGTDKDPALTAHCSLEHHPAIFRRYATHNGTTLVTAEDPTIFDHYWDHWFPNPTSPPDHEHEFTLWGTPFPDWAT